MNTKTINSKLFQSHKSVIRAMRKYQKESNEANAKLNTMIEDVIYALNNDSAVQGKSAKELRCEAAFGDFMDSFLEETSELNKIPMALIYFVYKMYCNRFSEYSFDTKAQFKHALLMYLELCEDKKWVFKEDQCRWPLNDDIPKLPKTLKGIEMKRYYSEFDRRRGVLVKVV
ncbi:hypothetical protein [Eubacterium oxidoreducens]|uniref:Uncharacterized protein n=1 Tax=Eubacterium oxidoreducens TaxID=1732 RepID=A0A1G6AR31_EUBOX|nr:hypothetical protein [Eubacterium oxidoreducens]SDB10876.1 hypothetical protein SAMN02910417_00876 [Eubacterium oxidoreducens]